MTDYRPIACVQHEKLEFAVLRRLRLHVELEDGIALDGHALDVYTKNGAEWLKFREDAGQESVIRLDRIRTFCEL